MWRPKTPDNFWKDRKHLDFQVGSYTISRTPPPRWNLPLDAFNSNVGDFRRSPDLAPGEFEQVDESCASSTVTVFGRTEDGLSVAVMCKFFPALVVQLHSHKSKVCANQLVAFLRKTCRLQPEDMIADYQLRFDGGGFHPDHNAKEPTLAQFPFLFLSFRTQSLFWNVRSVMMPRNEKWFYGCDFREIRKYKIGRKRLDNGHSVEIVEKMIPNILQWVQSTGIQPCGCARVDLEKARIVKTSPASTCDLELRLSITPKRASPIFLSPVQSDGLFWFVVHSFDIECVCPGGGFPSPDDLENWIICIAVTSFNFATGVQNQVVHALAGCGREFPEGVELFLYDSEIQLLEGWRDFLVTHEDPDMFTGYNIDKFDWYYMKRRAELRMRNSRFFFFGRLRCIPSAFESSNFSSKSQGSSDSNRFLSAGRINLDLFTLMKREYPGLDSYTLKNVCATYLEDANKDDLAISTMNKHWRSGDPHLRFLVLKYCLQDTLLPIMLMKRLNIITLQVEVARVFGVFLSDVFNRGQTFKVLSRIFVHARKQGFVLTNLPDYAALGIDTYQGATVLSCMAGFHENVIVLDFASLYPSIMIAKNLCYSTWVRNPRDTMLPNCEFFESKTDIGNFTFQQTIPGILPSLLLELLEARKVAKRAMKAAPNEFERQIMNGRQLALKISCNSVYGFTGALMCDYACPPIAATVTCYGRDLISRTKAYAEDIFNSVVIYGDTDSIFVLGPANISEEQMFDLGKRMGATISNQFSAAIVLEFEKLYSTYLIMTKKCYIGMKKETLLGKSKLEAKGYAMVRRDFCIWQRETMQTVVKMIFADKNVIGAMQFLSDEMSKVVCGTASRKKLVLTKKLAASYANPQIHNEVAKRVNKRTNNNGPKSGDRVQYYVVAKNDPKLFNRGADVEYADENKLELDAHYYTAALKSPIMKMFNYFSSEVRVEMLRLFSFYEGAAYRRVHGISNILDTLGSSRCNTTFVVREHMTIHEAPQPAREESKKEDQPKVQTLMMEFGGKRSRPIAPTMSVTLRKKKAKLARKKRSQGVVSHSLSFFFKRSEGAP
jgi:DNA polymerase elongation subunit (family B)